MAELNVILKEAGYTRINSTNQEIGLTGDIPQWLKEYFSAEENLDDFIRRNGQDGLEIMRTDQKQGYVFVGPLQLDRDYEQRMQTIRKRFEANKRKTIRYFVDIEHQLAGFSWKLNE